MPRSWMPAGLAAVLAVAGACDQAPGIAASDRAQFHVPWITSGLGERDSIGMPDLAVDAAVLARSWVISTEEITSDNCAVVEGAVPPGVHRLLRFSVTLPNLGDADIYVGDPNTHADPNGDGDLSDGDGLFEFDGCHRHYHYRNYATYELFPVHADGSLGTALRERKAGFCMIDTTPYTSANGGAAGQRVYYACGNPVFPGNQGISVGFADTYEKSLQGQYFLLDHPDEPAPPGEYLIRVTVNPGYLPGPGENCLVLDAANGVCRNFAESRYDNNVGEVRITIPADRNGKTGTPVRTAVDGIDDENRPRGG